MYLLNLHTASSQKEHCFVMKRLCVGVKFSSIQKDNQSMHVYVVIMPQCTGMGLLKECIT